MGSNISQQSSSFPPSPAQVQDPTLPHKPLLKATELDPALLGIAERSRRSEGSRNAEIPCHCHTCCACTGRFALGIVRWPEPLQSLWRGAGAVPGPGAPGRALGAAGAAEAGA